MRSSVASKGDKLPALPPTAQQQQSPQQMMPGGYNETMATIRHAEPPSIQTSASLQTPKARGSAPTSPIVTSTPSIQKRETTVLDEDDDEEEEDYGQVIESGEPYPPMEPQHDRHMTDLPDTAMLDSVVLPAIASVSADFSS